MPAGTLGAAALWGTALYYATPLQLLFLFLGKIDTERPSDRVLHALGRALKLRCASRRAS